MSTAQVSGPAASSGSSIIATSQPGGGGGSLAVEESGEPVATDVTTINLVGATVVDAGDGQVNVTIPGGSGTFSELAAQFVQLTPFLLTTALPAGTTDDWNPAGFQAFTVLHVVTDTNGSSLGGIAAPSGATEDGRWLILVNHGDGSGSYGAAPLTLLERASTSQAANQFVLPNLEDLVLPYTGSAILNYDTGAHQWICLGIAVGGRFIHVDADFFSVAGPVSPAALPTGNTNDYNPTGNTTATYLRVNANSAGSILTGLVVNPNGIAANEAQIKIIENLGGPLTLSNEDANSVAQNRFTLPFGSFVIPAGGLVALIYDTQGGGNLVQARWRLLGVPSLSKQTLYQAITDVGLASAVNNYDPTGFNAISRLRLAPGSGTSSISGMVAQEDGAVRYLTAYAAGITLLHQSGLSTTANQFFLPGAANLVLEVGGTAMMVYDATFGAWFCLGIAN